MTYEECVEFYYMPGKSSDNSWYEIISHK